MAPGMSFALPGFPMNPLTPTITPFRVSPFIADTLSNERCGLDSSAGVCGESPRLRTARPDFALEIRSKRYSNMSNHRKRIPMKVPQMKLSYLDQRMGAWGEAAERPKCCRKVRAPHAVQYASLFAYAERTCEVSRQIHESNSPPRVPYRALFVPHLRGEAPEGLTTGKDFHSSLCLSSPEGCMRYRVCVGTDGTRKRESHFSNASMACSQILTLRKSRQIGLDKRAKPVLQCER